MECPSDIDQPFFAYGLFKPGQLAFFQLRGLVSKTDPAEVTGELLLRDGLPILDPEGHGCVKGALVTFFPEQAAKAYKCISAMEPGNHYYWDKAPIGGTSANVLVGRSPDKGSVDCAGVEWNGWDDPLFREALDVVAETLKSQDSATDLKALFRLQMAYLLLWSSIERYVSLRYHLGKDATEKVNRLANERAFAEGLLEHVKEPPRAYRKIYRADQPKCKRVLNPRSSKKALNYYYQVRSNIMHRGKGDSSDHERVVMSLEELLPIFRKVLEAAELDARY